MHSEPASTREPPKTPPPSCASELDRAFRLIVFDWDGTAVESRSADASHVAGLCDRLLGIGARLAIVTGTNFANVYRQLGDHLSPANRRRLYLATNRGSEVYGFDWRGRPVVLCRREATAEENRLLDRIVDEAAARLTRLTGLDFVIVRDRMNRRKLDLIPEPAWRDPPKSDIGALLAATEARLRGAGLRHGLREAFELTEGLCVELGLPNARVTSDVKHLEVGLTDKADAMEYLMHQVAAPLGIPPAGVLILGDELGYVGGFEGSDHRMLAVPETALAVVVSVGTEPGGAPPSVLHLGGGPARFGQILEHQLLLDGRPLAPPRDAAWMIEEPGFDAAREHEIESLLAIANGYVGTRGSIAEGTSVSRPATFLAGAFEPSNDLSQVPELLIAPEWGRLRFVVEGEPFSVEHCQTVRHVRTLDLRHGRLLRECVTRDRAGRETSLRTLHLASLADRHLLLEAVELSPCNYTGTVRVEAILSGDVKSASGAAHWESFEVGVEPAGPSLQGRTRAGLTAAMSSHLTIDTKHAGDATRTRSEGSTWAAETCDLGVELAQASELHRVVTLFTTRDTDAPEEAAHALAGALSARPAAELAARHDRAWLERWRHADVEIDGAPGLERAVRFGMYHLLASANPDDPRASIGARALTGQAYRGHVFWDTDIFMLPFFVHAWPEAARALVGYRYHTLGGARRKARAAGYDGALYAWESADSGDETTPSLVVTPFGEVIRVLSGEQEHHISADVAYAVSAYARATADAAFLETEGLAMLVETARFWASRGRMGADGRYHIDRVIGPDEYHEGVDDNAFTNWLARYNLRAAARAIAEAPAAAEAFGVGPQEAGRFRAVAEAMYLGQDPKTGLIEQFAGYHALEPFDARTMGEGHAAIDVLFGRARTQASQVVKQADVVELVALLWDELCPEARLACFRHYEPRTSHGSSLSPAVHALVAARLGLAETAARYLEQTAEIDLGNTMGNSAGGVHAAAMGGLWQAVVLGVGGLRPAPGKGDALLFEPHLLPGWRHLGFPFAWRGATLEVHVEPEGVEVSVTGDRAVSLRLAAGESSGRVHEVRAEPGRRYAGRRTQEGHGPWEECRS